MNDLIIQKLKGEFPASIQGTDGFRDDLTVQVKREDIVKVCRFLKDDYELSFDMLIDLLGVDMYRPEGRFEVVYILYSLKNKKYLRLKVLVDEEDPVVDTLGTVWSGASWHERETYDMFGINSRAIRTCGGCICRTSSSTFLSGRTSRPWGSPIPFHCRASNSLHGTLLHGHQND